jgi:MFS family permease
MYHPVTMQAAESTMIEANTVDKSQRSAFIAAWLGWAFDGLDGFLYSLIAVPFVRELLGKGASAPEAAAKAGLIQAMFLVGWAIGGIVFGRIGDSMGRTRTLNLTIITYAAFTGLAFFAHSWWQLAIFRFLAALGIGGEWAAGSALVSETLPNRYRPWASAMLQTGYMCGMILAALTVGAFSHLPYRYVFLVGVLPAVFTIWIRRAVPEPKEWSGHRSATVLPKISDLFRGELLKVTLFTLTIASLALTCSWVLLYFSTQVLRGLPEVKAMTKVGQDELVRSVTITYALWNIVGNFLAATMARWLGYRPAMIIMILGGLISYVIGFEHPRPLEEVKLWLNLSAGFGLALFALFPLYIPPLFPTLLRTTGAGFCYNFGRIVAGGGTLFLALSTSAKISPNEAIYSAGLLYVPMMLVAFFMPILKEKVTAN